jgi:hypothetical protein
MSALAPFIALLGVPVASTALKLSLYTRDYPPCKGC